MVAVPLRCFYPIITFFQLGFLQLAHGGAYYGHKQPPQQHQPLPQYNDGYPQQQFLGNEMPLMPLLPQYGKELPHFPLQKGKERPLTEGKGEVNWLVGSFPERLCVVGHILFNNRIYVIKVCNQC